MEHNLGQFSVGHSQQPRYFSSELILSQFSVRVISRKSYCGFNFDCVDQDRFGKTEQIILAHMDELIKTPPCHNDHPMSLRCVYDQISVCTRGLASLGVSSEQYGSLLIPIIMSQLPNEM